MPKPTWNKDDKARAVAAIEAAAREGRLIGGRIVDRKLSTSESDFVGCSIGHIAIEFLGFADTVRIPGRLMYMALNLDLLEADSIESANDFGGTAESRFLSKEDVPRIAKMIYDNVKEKPE